MKNPNRRPNCKCALCDKEIYRAPSLIEKGNVFCSLSCSGVFSRKDKKLNEENKKIKFNPLKIKLSQCRGGVCEKCQNINFAILQVHHVIEKSKGGSDELDNLLLLCPNCHALEHFDPNASSAFQMNDDLEMGDD